MSLVPDAKPTEPDGGEDEVNEEDKIVAAPFLFLDDSVSSARVRPTEPPYLSGRVSMHSFGDGEITFSVAGEREGVEIEVGFQVGADEAERLGELFKSFAKKCRSGEQWVYP